MAAPRAAACGWSAPGLRPLLRPDATYNPVDGLPTAASLRAPPAWSPRPRAGPAAPRRLPRSSLEAAGTPLPRPPAGSLVHDLVYDQPVDHVDHTAGRCAPAGVPSSSRSVI